MTKKMLALFKVIDGYIALMKQQDKPLPATMTVHCTKRELDAATAGRPYFGIKLIANQKPGRGGS